MQQISNATTAERMEAITAEALRGAIGLVELLNHLSDREDEGLFEVAVSVRNVVWAQRDLLQKTLLRVDNPSL